MNFSRALVTGGAGFIGSHLVDRLLENDCEVFVVDNLSTGDWSNLEHHEGNSKFLFEKINIINPELYSAFRVFRPEVVFHLAAIPGVEQSVKEPVRSAETNLLGTANILANAKEFDVKRVVFASSSSVYGGAEIFPTPEACVLNPKSPYAFYKAQGEEMCKYYSDVEGVDTASLRFFNVFGPRQKGNSAYSAVIPAFLEAKKNNLTPNIYGDGEQTRDFCYVENVVAGLILAAIYEKNLKGEAFNIGCGERISVNEIYNMISPPEAKFYEERKGDVRHSCADIIKAKRILDYKPLISFKEGIQKTIDAYMMK